MSLLNIRLILIILVGGRSMHFIGKGVINFKENKKKEMQMQMERDALQKELKDLEKDNDTCSFFVFEKIFSIFHQIKVAIGFSKNIEN